MIMLTNLIVIPSLLFMDYSRPGSVPFSAFVFPCASASKYVAGETIEWSPLTFVSKVHTLESSPRRTSASQRTYWAPQLLENNDESESISYLVPQDPDRSYEVSSSS